MNATIDKPDNMFLSGSLPILFIKTAAPIILIMMVNGIHTLIDAYFLGEYVGADALTAVTLMFPAFMLMVALSTLVSNGYSSVLARLLGAAGGVVTGVEVHNHPVPAVFGQPVGLPVLVFEGERPGGFALINRVRRLGG